MSDVVVVAIITGAVGIVSSIATYVVGRQQAATEVAKLRLQHVEDGRRHRQQVYHDTLVLLDKQLEAAATLDAEAMVGRQTDTWREELRHLQAGVDLFGSDDAASAVADYANLYAEAAMSAYRLTQLDHDDALGREDVYGVMAFLPRLRDARNRVTHAMREDIGGAGPRSPGV